MALVARVEDSDHGPVLQRMMGHLSEIQRGCDKAKKEIVGAQEIEARISPRIFYCKNVKSASWREVPLLFQMFLGIPTLISQAQDGIERARDHLAQVRDRIDIPKMRAIKTGLSANHKQWNSAIETVEQYYKQAEKLENESSATNRRLASWGEQSQRLRVDFLFCLPRNKTFLVSSAILSLFLFIQFIPEVSVLLFSLFYVTLSSKALVLIPVILKWMICFSTLMLVALRSINAWSYMVPVYVNIYCTLLSSSIVFVVVYESRALGTGNWRMWSILLSVTITLQFLVSNVLTYCYDVDTAICTVLVVMFVVITANNIRAKGKSFAFVIRVSIFVLLLYAILPLYFLNWGHFFGISLLICLNELYVTLFGLDLIGVLKV